MKAGQKVKIIWGRDNKTYEAVYVGRRDTAPIKGLHREEYPHLFHIPVTLKYSDCFPSLKGQTYTGDYKMFVNEDMTKAHFNKSVYESIFSERTLTRLPHDTVEVILED